jgi:alkylation response protein AidB-like acyl-CoA dehydrogenase
MDLRFTEEQQEFRLRARAWLAANVPTGPPPLHDMKALRDYDTAWQRCQYEAGWAGVSWPVAYGGMGLSLVEQLIWYEEYARVEAPHLGSSFVGLSHAGPTLIQSGSEAQKSAHLPAILRGDVIWCQGFSEPGAGSDLASLRTRAVLDGGCFVVNGQKIWTSYADQADYQELLVRTDPAVPKHRGITWLICDMHTPGITVRPIETIDGHRHFCEVYYDDVRVPVTNVVGDVNGGWQVAITTLSFERGTAFMAEQVSLAQMLERLVDLCRKVPGPGGSGPAIGDDEIRRALGLMRAEVLALRAMTYMGVSRTARHGTPGPAGSMLRLYHSQLMQRVCQLAVEVLGVEGLRERLPEPYGLQWPNRYLYSQSRTIGGGTKDIQRNIIAERVLGLPKGR